MTPQPPLSPVELKTDEETHRYVERLGMVCADGVPTAAQIEMARGDVRRFRSEQEEE